MNVWTWKTTLNVPRYCSIKLWFDFVYISIYILQWIPIKAIVFRLKDFINDYRILLILYSNKINLHLTFTFYTHALQRLTNDVLCLLCLKLDYQNHRSIHSPFFSVLFPITFCCSKKAITSRFFDADKLLRILIYSSASMFE